MKIVPGQPSSCIQAVNGVTSIEDKPQRVAGFTALLSTVAVFSTLIYSLAMWHVGIEEVIIYTLICLFLGVLGIKLSTHTTVFIDGSRKTITWTSILWNWKKTRVRFVADFENIRLSRTHNRKSGDIYHVHIKGAGEELELARFTSYEEACMGGRRIIDVLGLPFEYLE